MNRTLSTVGACSIVIFIIYFIKKIDDYLFFKREEYQEQNNIDEATEKENYYEDFNNEPNKLISTNRTDIRGNKYDSVD